MEYGITYTLTTPAGDLTFNPVPSNIDGFYLTAIAGLDGGAVRSQVSNLPQRDGGYLFDAPLGPAYPTLTGLIRSSTKTNRGQAIDELKSKLDTIRNADGTLTFTPNDGDSIERALTVRLIAPVGIAEADGLLKTFQVQLVAVNPRAGKSTQSSFTIGQPTGGPPEVASTTVTPGGNTTAYPTVTVTGPLAAPIIRNATTGVEVSLPTLTLAGSDTLVVDMYNETVEVNDASVIGDLDISGSEFWGLAPGVTATIQLKGTSSTAATGADGAYNDTYV